MTSAHHVLHAATPAQRVASGPGHPVRGGPGCGNSVRPRLGPVLHEDGRSAVRHRREGEELCRHLSGGHHRSARLQQDVRTVRPVHYHVLLQEQAHHDRLGHRQQQQDQLGTRRQAGDD